MGPPPGQAAGATKRKGLGSASSARSMMPHEPPLPDEAKESIPHSKPDGSPARRAQGSKAEPAPEIPLELLDRDALAVIHRLRSFGHQAYLVGGCVRDLLLGRTPKDYDVATSAHPGEIRAIFRNCRLIGRRFRLAHVYFAGGKVVETATFRSNPLPEEGAEDLLITRDNVFGTAEEDARRRDFTINGLFYDVILGRVIDYVGGREDLKKRRIRTIGDPEVRMQEDPVRLMRAIRFAAKLDLEIAPETWDAMARYKGELARCAPPRVLEEIFRLLRSGHAERCFELLYRLNGLQVLLPPLAAYLNTASAEGAAMVFRSLSLLDELVRRGPLPDDAVLLAVLASQLAAAQREEKRAAATPWEEDEGEGADAAEGDRELEDLERKLGEAGEAEEEVAEVPVVPWSASADAAEGDRELEDLERKLGEAGEAEEEVAEVPVVPWSASAAAAQSPEDLLTELVRTARLPRRIAEKSRLLLHALKVLSGERKRRGSPMRFVRQPYFPDALAVFRIQVEATGEGKEALARWEARALEAGVIEPEETSAGRKEAERAAAEEAPGERRAGKRRKRRGRKETSEAQAANGEAERSEGESLPPPAERLPPEGPADFLPF